MNDIKNEKNNGAYRTGEETKRVRDIYSEIKKYVEKRRKKLPTEFEKDFLEVM